MLRFWLKVSSTRIDPTDLEKLAEIERDAHNNVRFAEINFGENSQNAGAGAARAIWSEGNSCSQEYRL